MTRNLSVVIGIFIIVAVLLFVIGVARSVQPGVKHLDQRELSEQIRSCVTGTGYRQSCLRKIAETLVVTSKPSDALAAMSGAVTSLGFLPGCHELTHYIGQESYRKFRSIKEAFSEGTYECYGAYYHGVIEGFFSEFRRKVPNAEYDSLAPILIDTCEQARGETPVLYTECLHGIGHGLMFISDMDVPRALSVCDTLTLKSERQSCYGGVFMENSTSTTQDGHVSVWVRSDDPSYPCTVLDAPYKASCYQYQGTYVAVQTVGEAGSWDAVITFCNRIPEEFRQDCFFTIGTNQPSGTEDLTRMYAVCSQASDESLRQACVRGVVASLTGWYQGDPARSVRLCSAVSSEDSAICYRQIGSSLLAWTGSEDETDRLCDGVGGKEHSSWCREGKYLEGKNE